MEDELNTAMSTINSNPPDPTDSTASLSSDRIAAFRFQLEDLRDAHLDLSAAGLTISLLNDQLVALSSQLENFRYAQLRSTDQRMQQSIYRAMLADTAAVDSALVDGAASDANDEAPRVIGKDGYYEDPRIDPSGSTQLDEYVGNLTLDESQPPQTCPTCLEMFSYSQSIEVGNCTHRWCRACLIEAFEHALRNEAGYPVGCCKELPAISIDEAVISKALGAKFVEDFQQKIIEYSTNDRTYCHRPACSTFIAPDTIQGRMAVCPSCQTQACSTCKLAFHVQDQCQAADDLAFDEWRTSNEASTCPRCRRTILITYGCNHMTYVYESLIWLSFQLAHLQTLC